ncbi:CARDB domain-containing protein [Chlorogloeopsis sp. ULAP01]|uniref:CARDB domain-containing protein n=1 Tax=Chlorogloeopsis sp. ULAP01 TaxID=3056483 RepID=UPI0025AB0546|nr:CARDB domain-containing protein [Chlorogloeopsis sp. ULAP01]MDM9385689.1 CARDB domain-containing protein [Chlorogloeopsis sp. ULAP01]
MVTLDLSSPSFDTYLQLIDADTGLIIAYDDDSGSGYNSLLRFTPVDGIKYIVRATSYSSGVTGTYTLNAAVGAPDLVVTATNAPITAPERSIISLTWTVTNQGEAVARNDWYDYVYLSDNTILDSSDRYIGNVWSGDKIPLAPGASYTASTNMVLPERIGSGKQYLLFVANRDNYLFEESETNNVRAVAIEITVPDLVVTGATAPVAVTVGSVAEVSWTVLNQGSVSATHSWYDRIYLSNDQILDGSDTQVGGFDSGTPGTPVAAGDTYSLTKTVTIPKTALGSRYLLFVTDADNNHYETNETNNIKAIPVQVNAPDLIVFDASAPTTAALGEQITVNWQVTNQGSVTADTDWYDYFYLSDDQILDGSDQYISYKWTGDKTPLASNTSYTATHNFTIPTDAKAGNRYLLFVADRDNYQGETNKNNNVNAVPIYIKAADLVVDDASTSASSVVPGSTLTLSYTVKNQGETTAARDWYDRIYLSNDTVYDDSDYQLYHRWISAQTPLAVDGTYTVNDITVTLPNNLLGQPGSRYLIFIADRDNYQSETNESNNVKAIPIIITGDNADLEVTAATAPRVVSTQQNVSVSWTVKNTGALTASADWYDSVYISSDSTLDASDTILRDEWVSSQTPLVVNGQYTLSRDITIPQGRNGSQYLLFVADSYNYQSESTKANNVHAVPIEVRTPDLQVTNATAPVQAYAGARMEVAWTVSNKGNESAFADWYDSVYLSDDNTLSTATDILLKDVQIGNLTPLADGTSYTVTQLLSVPNNVTKGSKYLLFVADRRNQQGELNEGNNVRVVPISIGDPDLNLPLLQTGSPVQNQNIPQLVTNPNPGNYATLPALLEVGGTGLLGQYYVPGGTVSNFPNYDAIAPLLTRVDQTINFGSTSGDFGANLGQVNHFAARWTGKINIATEGNTTFYINSNDGARLYIDNQLVVDNGGVHNFQERSATIYLTSGQHDLRLEYFEYDQQAGVTLSYTPVGGSKQVVPSSILTPASLTPLESDLQISGITAPATFGRGQSINTSWTVTNLGSSSTQGVWADQIYLSDDTTLDSNDTRLASFVGSSAPLAATASYTQAKNIIIPTNTGLGNKYLLFVTNPDRPESDRTNNAYALPVTITNPDLIVTEATAPSTAAERSSILVNWTVKNQGSVPTQSNGWYDSVYLSDNTVFDSSDRYMSDLWTSGNLTAEGTYSKSQSFTLPNQTGSGKWYLLVITDRNNYQAETSDTNNVYAIPINITVPDLTITTSSTPTTAAVGETVSVSWTVKNAGAVSAASDRYDSVYLSDDPTFDATDTYVTDFYRSGSSPLAAGASEVRTGNITIPNSKLGDRYLLFVGDSTNSQSETDETNNVWATQIAITAPDLVVSDAAAPIVATQGETVSVSWTVTNSGDVIAGRDWYDSIYLSDDTTFDGSDQYVTDRWISEKTPLAALSSYNIQQNITIPTYAKAGNRYLLFVADRDNYQGETNENNNFKAVPIYIKAADLIVSDASASDTTVAPGSTLTLSYTVKNQGESTTSQDWDDWIYLSNDAVYDDSDYELSYRWISTETPLAVDGTYTVNKISVTLPDNAVGQAGNRYLLFVTDRNNNQRETNESNNVKAIPIIITGDNADLEVTAATAPSVVSTQQNVSVSWTVKNTGILTASADWYDFVYISNDSTLDASDTILRDEWVSSQTPLAVNGQYNLTSNITIPQVRTGNQYLLFVADGYNYQGELNEVNNVRAVPITVQTPDLVVNDATVPVKSYPGTQIEVSWTVKNQGNASANADWYDRIYLSDDATLNTSTDTLLKEVWTSNLTPLPTGDDYSISQLLTLPNTTPIGSRYLLFVADIYNNQGETNENNNVRAISIVIGDNDPDLTVTAATAPTTAVLGETIAVNWTVLNQGNIEASTDWYDTIYLSDDETLDSNDMAVSSQSVAEKTPLAVNATYNFNRDITIPNATTGNRYLLFVADAGKQQSERDETNNVRAVPITLTAPDLVVSSASTTVEEATWGETIQVSWTVANTLAVMAAATWSDQIYISDDTTLDGTDKFVATFSAASYVPLAGNSSYTQTNKSITIPTNSGTGSKYLLFVADANDAQGETDNNNNVRAIPFEVKAPNLQVTDANAPTTATWGETINVSWMMTNQGTGAALADWWDYVYLSSNPTLDGNDTYLGNLSAANQSPLVSGGSYTKNRNVTIPTVTPGTWYLLFATDNNGNQQAESNETDNVRAVALEIKAPDLVVSAVTAPTSSILSATIPVSWTVTNQGTGAALADWWDYVYLSANQTLDGNDTFVGNLWTGDETPLAAGASYTVGRNVTVPNVTAGTWYLLFAADRDNYQSETDNNNNLKAVAIELGVPDIELTAATAPETASTFETIQVGWTVTNTGNIVAPADWSDYVYLSDDATVDENDIQLGYLSAADQTPLSAGTSYTQTLNVTIPGTARGNKYLLFVADRNNTQGESNESNNVRALQLTVNAPDLIVSDATAPNRAILGETIDVSWTVTNSGSGSAFADWYDSIYLSDDANFDVLDTYVADFWTAEKTPLAPGASYSIAQKITVPNTATGNRYLLFVADRTNNQGETNESNNVKAIAVTVGSLDLIPTITSSPITATSGTTVSLEWSVSNAGSAEATGNWVDRIYLSTDNKFDTSDLLLKEEHFDGSLLSGDSYLSQLDLNLPLEVSGNRYLLVVTDANKQIKELGAEENNVAASLINIELAPYADLTVSNVTAPALTVGDPAQVMIGWTVTNLGTGIGQTNTWVDRIIASTDSIIGNRDDILLASFSNLKPLNLGENYTRSEKLRLSPGFQGQYQLFVQTDATGVVFENNLEANNIAVANNTFSVVPIPYADLVVDEVQVQSNASSGQKMQVSWTVANNGIGTTNTNSWSDRVFLATDPEGKNIVANLGSFEQIGALAVGGTYNRSVDVTLPNGLSGTYYLVVTTGGPFEFIYTNNNSRVSNAVLVTLTPPPDLVVTNVTSPTTAVQSGSKIDVSWSVENSATGDATGTWVDSIFIREAGNANGQLISLGSFTYGNGLVAGKSYTRSEQFVLPSTLQGLYEVVVKTNTSNSLYEHGATGNNITTAANPILLSLAPRPDLQVKQIIAPTTANAGGTISLEFIVANEGIVATTTPNWQDRVYLSLDDKISSDDLYFSFSNAAALGSLESYRTQANTLVIPKYFRGKAYLIVQTDAAGQVNEYPQESNNTSFVELNINSLPPADLVTSDVVAPTLAFEGSKIKVRYTVTNQGIGESDRDNWTDTIWLTRDKNRPSPANREGGAEDILLTSVGHSGSLKVGSSYETEVEVTLPSQVTGEWYITPWTDAYNVVLEDTLSINNNPDDPNELDNNNYKARPITILLTPPPDLVVTSVTPTVQAVGGQPFSVSWEVKNQGANSTSENRWFDSVYLSDNPTLNAPGAKQWYLGRVERTGSLGVNQTYTSKLDTVLTPGAAGKYIIVQTNYDNYSNSVWEGPYTNNNQSSAETNVTSTPADLIVTNVKTLPQNFSGEGTTVEWTVQNVGSDIWSGTRYWYDEIWVSPDPTFIPSRATKVGFVPYSSQQPLRTGDSYTQKHDITLPAGIDGEYYIHVSTDYSYDYNTQKFRGEIPSSGDNNSSRQSFEYRVFEDPSNNLGNAIIPVTYKEPDLQITNLVVPQTPPTSGQTISVSWTVTNTGTRDTRQTSWSDRVYLSRDQSLDLNDTLLGQFARRNGLKQGESYTSSGEITLPDGIEGNYYLLLFTDSNITEQPSSNSKLGLDSNSTFARVPEFKDEGNNITFAPLQVILQPAADLQVTSIKIPERATTGQTFNLEYTVTNNGAGDTPIRQSKWRDLIYLSRDEFLDLQADRYLGYFEHTDGLKALSSYTVNKTLTLPVDLTGPYYVFVITDAPQNNVRGQVFEGNNEGNNAKPSAQPLILQLPPPADLQVDEITIPATAKSGDSIQISFKVTNRGDNPATGEWSDAVYLSEDAIWDINDRPIGRVTYSGNLATDASYTSTLTANLPPATPGQYRIIVRSDIFNSVYEADFESNNRTTSADTLEVTVEQLQLGVPLNTTLNTGQERLFQIDLQAGQTLRINTTSSATDTANEVFVRFQSAPTSIVYDAAYTGELGANQSVVIPTTKSGTYYVLVRGYSQPSNNTPISILADVLPFGITDVIADRGGDSRYVTANIFGAQFQPEAIVKLVRPTIAEYIPVRSQVIDSTKITAIFDLTNAPHGLYDVKVINPDGREAIVPYRYLVERAIEPDVTVGLGGPSVLAPGDFGTYGVSVQSLTNIDTPYVHFSIGTPQLGTNSDVFNLPYTEFSSNLRGNPEGVLQDVPWASLISDVNTNGEIIAPGYVLDLPNAGFVGRTFNVQTYPGLQEELAKDPKGLEDVSDDAIAFRFHILATATAMTRDEFVQEQTQQALLLRNAILLDQTASQALTVLAADANTWTNAYLAALEEAGLLRPEDEAPPIRENPQVISLMATLATGLLLGPAGNEIISNGNLVSFFEQIRKWYGHNPSLRGQELPPNPQQFDLGLSRKTHVQSFNVYVPFGEARVDLPQGVSVPPPNFASFFNAAGTTSNLATLTGPVGFGAENIVPLGAALPYTIRFENAATASTAVGEVRIVTKLDSDLDPRNFQLGDLRLGDIQVHIPAGRATFSGDFDFIRSKGFILRVSAGLDVISNTATWLVQAIDPNTGEVMQNPNIGLLPPNNANGVGSGFVTYSVLPLAGSATGTEITTEARVIFNTAAPIDTARVTNIIDGVAPTTVLTVTPLVAGGSDYLVNWTATDDAAGAGVKHVTVYVAEDGSTYRIWKQQTTETSGVYTGRAGHTYEFLALATDNAGNREQPGLGISTPNDGFQVNLGTLPMVEKTTQPDLGTPPAPNPEPSTNGLFLEAKQGIPAVAPTTNPSEFKSVLRPFTAAAFATGIPNSHANIAPLAITILEDGSVLASGGANRGSLYRFDKDGGAASTPIATLSQPIFDMAVDSNNTLWATTGGGPLLQLDLQTGKVVKQYGDSITQALAIQKETGLIYVSSGKGIEIFNPQTETFTHYSDLRVDSLAFDADRKLWATTWPERGDIVRFNEQGKAQRMLSFDSPVDSIAFGMKGTRLEGLLFVSNNNTKTGTQQDGRIYMVDLATLQYVTLASGGSRGENIETTADGRVLLSQSHQIDVFSPLVAPQVKATNPAPDAIVALPQGTISITFDSDMYAGAANDTASVLNPANFELVSSSGTLTPQFVRYDALTRTVLLDFNTITPGEYEIQVSPTIKSAAGVELTGGYQEQFTAISDFSSLVDFQFSNARSDRASQTISYDVTLTSKADWDLQLPLMLLLDPAQYFTGVPTSATRDASGAYLIDLRDNLPQGVLKGGQSTTVRTITVYDPDALRVEFTPGIYALPYPNQAPIITSNPVLTAFSGQQYTYQVAANDPDGAVLGYLLYDAPLGMSVDSNGLITWTPTQSSPASSNVTLQVYDLRGAQTTQTFSLNVVGGNHLPVFNTPVVTGGTVSSPTPSLPHSLTPSLLIKGAEAKPLQIQLNATDSDRNQLTFWANNLPGGATFDSKTGVLTWTPGYEAAGTYENVQFTVSDGETALREGFPPQVTANPKGIERVTQTATILIAPTNQAPTLIRPADRIVREGEKVRIQLQATDADIIDSISPLPTSDFQLPTSSLTYNSNLLPGGSTLDPRTGLFEWTPAYFQAGEFEIPFTVSDGESFTTQTTKITVLNVNAAPVFDDFGTWQVQSGQQVRFRAFAFDPDNPGFVPQDRNADGQLTILEGSDPSVTYTVSGLPDGATFDPVTAMFIWTPGFSSAGTYNVTFTATDDGNGTSANKSATVTVPITVFNTNRAPQISEFSNITLNRGEVQELVLQATDADGDPLVLQLKPESTGYELPSFVTFTDNGDGTGKLRLTPGVEDSGDYTLVLTATDNGNGGGGNAVQQDEYTFVVSVNAPNDPPKLPLIGDKVAVVGEQLQFLIQASDRNQDNLTFNLNGLPVGATLTPTGIYGQALLQWTPTAADINTYPVTTTVTDSGNGNQEEILSSQQQFNLVVRTSNTTPVLAPITNSSVAEGQTLTLQLAATDADGDILTYTANNLPTGAVLDPVQGILTWKPNFTSGGTYNNITLTASDGNRSSSQTFSINVTNTNIAPVLAPLPVQTGKENSIIEFTLAAGDIDTDSLIYSAVSSLPTGATLDPRSGKFSWKPNYEQAGEYVLTFAATDPFAARDTRDVTLRVANVNRTPTLTVSDRAVALGNNLSFNLVATDPDFNTTLTYSVDNLPEGATLDATTGQFSWSPSPGQVGDYSVTFAVSDNEATVTQTSLIQVALAPEPPTVTVDLTPSFPAVPGQKVVVQAVAKGLADITSLSATIDGSPVTIDSQGRFSFTPTTAGRAIVEVIATDADGRIGTTSTVIKVRDPEDSIAPVVAFVAGLDGSKLTEVTDIIGSISDRNLDNWVLSVADFGSNHWSAIAGGNQLANGVLAEFDPTKLENGFYQLRLQATDISGRTSSTQVVVEANSGTNKSAYVRTETDLSITFSSTLTHSLPGSLTPLNLVRTYSSLNASDIGSFGYGWQLANTDANIQTNVPLTGREQLGVYEPFRVGTRLYLTLPTGERVGFTFAPQKHTIPGLTYYTPAWVADAGVNYTLQSADAVLTLAGNRLYDLKTGHAYNPASGEFNGAEYTLSSADGTVYYLSTSRGVVEQVAANGTRFVYSDSGITSSTGETYVLLRMRLDG